MPYKGGKYFPKKPSWAALPKPLKIGKRAGKLHSPESSSIVPVSPEAWAETIVGAIPEGVLTKGEAGELLPLIEKAVRQIKEQSYKEVVFTPPPAEAPELDHINDYITELETKVATLRLALEMQGDGLADFAKEVLDSGMGVEEMTGMMNSGLRGLLVSFSKWIKDACKTVNRMASIARRDFITCGCGEVWKATDPVGDFTDIPHRPDCPISRLKKFADYFSSVGDETLEVVTEADVTGEPPF